MKITPRNIIHNELIGLDTEVVDSTNTFLVGIGGRVVDETRNMLTVDIGEGEKKVPKSGSSFIFTIPSFDGKRYLPSKIKINGRLLLSQPENRIQTKFKKKFRK